MNDLSARKVHITVDTCGFEVSAADLVAVIAAHNADPLAHLNLAGGGTSQLKEILPSDTTLWTLSRIPSTPHTTQFFINGQKQEYGIDYVIDGSQLNWLGYELRPHWRIEIYYV